MRGSHRLLEVMDFYCDSEQLIGEVQKHPCLFDLNSDSYKDRNAKAAAWHQVMDALCDNQWDQMPFQRRKELEKEIQKRWKSLRDAFVKAWKYEQLVANDTNAKRRKPYVYLNQMSFLIPTLRFQQQMQFKENTFNETNGNSSILDEIQPIVTIHPRMNVQTSYDEEAVSDEGSWSKSRSNGMETNNNFPYDEESLKLSSQLLEKMREENDPDRMFLLSLLPNFRQLSQHEKMDAQIDMIQTIRRRLRRKTDEYNGSVHNRNVRSDTIHETIDLE